MTEGQKYEYEIALKIYNYDLSIIEKEVEQMNKCLKNCGCDEDKTHLTFCYKRLEDLLPLRNKKIKQINELKEKYKA